MIGRCGICAAHGEVKSLPLYPFGSEGLDICESCEFILIEMVRYMSHIAGRAGIAAIHMMRKLNKEVINETPPNPSGSDSDSSGQ